jgi:hypothetical protein
MLFDKYSYAGPISVLIILVLGAVVLALLGGERVRVWTDFLKTEDCHEVAPLLVSIDGTVEAPDRRYQMFRCHEGHSGEFTVVRY